MYLLHGYHVRMMSEYVPTATHTFGMYQGKRKIMNKEIQELINEHYELMSKRHKEIQEETEELRSIAKFTNRIVIVGAIFATLSWLFVVAFAICNHFGFFGW